MVAACSSPAGIDVTSAAPCAELVSIRVTQELERAVLADRAPDAPRLSLAANAQASGAQPSGAATAIAVGPVLGSMDLRDVATTAACDAGGVEVTATITRSAEYRGAVQKNVLWRPRLEIVLVPRAAGTRLTTTWRMRLTTGAELSRTRMPPYPEQSYPLRVTLQISAPVR